MRNRRYDAHIYLRERYYALRPAINQISQSSGEIMTRQQNSAWAESGLVTPSSLGPSRSNTSLGHCLGAGRKSGAPLSGEDV